MTIGEIQTALKIKGFDVGEVDGVWGRRTIAAVRAFQRANGLEVDGVVGSKTLVALGAGAPAVAGSPDTGDTATPRVWFEEAKRLRGLREQVGPGSNSVIVDWATRLGLDYDSDDIPWCGLFVAHCVGATLPDEQLPNNPLGARNWLTFGVQSQPTLGAIMVFWREQQNGAKGHVAFYDGEDSSAYHVVGGNQSNSVSSTRIAKERLLGARWPTTVPALPRALVLRDSSGKLSTNEG